MCACLELVSECRDIDDAGLRRLAGLSCEGLFDSKKKEKSQMSDIYTKSILSNRILARVQSTAPLSNPQNFMI